MPRIAFLFFILLSTKVCAQQTDLFDESHTIAFARHLYYSGQYNFAIDEFERALFLNKNNDTIKYFLLNTYLKAGKLTEGINATKRLFPDNLYSNYRVVLIYSKMLVAGNSKNLPSYAEQVKRDTLQTLMYMQSALQATDWKTAQAYFEAGINKDKTLFEPFTSIIEQSKHVKYRSGFAAGTMSAILPGSGKVYTGNWKDGVISLIMISATTFQSYRGYSRKGLESPKFWIFGTISAGFYLGNIYGSAKSAQKFNRKQNDALVKKSKQIYLSLDSD
jgi:tetratricopeptide (TPR) repeat protein